MMQTAIISISIGLLSFVTIMMAAQLIDAMAAIKPDEVFSQGEPNGRLPGRSESQK